MLYYFYTLISKTKKISRHLLTRILKHRTNSILLNPLYSNITDHLIIFIIYKGRKFEYVLILKFTCEISKTNKIPILDVNVQILKNKFVTSVYTKETNDGNLIIYNSECPSRNKIGTLLNRAL